MGVVCSASYSKGATNNKPCVAMQWGMDMLQDAWEGHKHMQKACNKAMAALHALTRAKSIACCECGLNP